MNVLAIKRAVRERDGFRCVECGISSTEHIKRHGRNLEVHRQSPGSKYAVEGCITLCKPCHDKKPKSPYGSCPDGVVAIHPSITEALGKLAERNATSIPVEANRLIREGLEKMGLWPPTKE